MTPAPPKKSPLRYPPQARLQSWLSKADICLIQGFVRPGCTQLILDLVDPRADVPEDGAEGRGGYAGFCL